MVYDMRRRTRVYIALHVKPLQRVVSCMAYSSHAVACQYTSYLAFYIKCLLAYYKRYANNGTIMSVVY